MNAFIKLGVIEPLAQALYQQGIRIPTVIQQASIPAILREKTSSAVQKRERENFGVPVAAGTACGCKKGGTQVLIMTPTRELAKQILMYCVLLPSLWKRTWRISSAGGRLKPDSETEEGTAYHYWNARTSFGSYTPPQSGFIRGKNGCS